jgi:GC-rich sequence DNA-binding factor
MAIDSVAMLIQSSLESTKSLVRGVSPYPTPDAALKCFMNRRFKLLHNLLLWRKHAGDLFGVGNLIGQLIDRSMVPILKKSSEVGANILRRKLQDIVPEELLPQL